MNVCVYIHTCVCVDVCKGVCTSSWLAAAGLRGSCALVQATLDSWDPGEATGQTRHLSQILERSVLYIRKYMHTFPTNELLSWSARGGNRMRALVLFVFVWVLSVSVCVSGYGYIYVVCLCMCVCVYWEYMLCLATGWTWGSLGSIRLEYSNPHKAKTQTNTEGYSAHALSFT